MLFSLVLWALIAASRGTPVDSPDAWKLTSFDRTCDDMTTTCRYRLDFSTQIKVACTFEAAAAAGFNTFKQTYDRITCSPVGGAKFGSDAAG